MKVEIVLIDSETGEVIDTIPNVRVPRNIEIQVLYEDGELETLDSVYIPM